MPPETAPAISPKHWGSGPQVSVMRGRLLLRRCRQLTADLPTRGRSLNWVARITEQRGAYPRAKSLSTAWRQNRPLPLDFKILGAYSVLGVKKSAWFRGEACIL
jgi:hypothetical protein